MTQDSRPAGRPRRGQSTLDPHKIGQAAVEVLRQEGAGALTVSKVAARLGVRSQTLYYHVSTLSDIVNAARGVLIAGADPTVRSGETWEESVLRFVDEYYLEFGQLAQANSVFFTHEITDEATLRTYETFVSQAIEAGVAGTDALQLLLDLEHTLFSLIFEHTTWHGLFALDAIDAAGATTLMRLLQTRTRDQSSLRERLRVATAALIDRAVSPPR